ncbi:hypothetical protein Gasu2_68010 [Galdieria sulphuraria]|uniref:Uncharacterized protein n=1 Tax=Galdieria sulphuraria TaxID=130081 RepID=M2XZR3_GALSU|nr:uncharacterized protein Gasu_34620 [Galdieria sulphuraria]EME29069.1 hypothetical protein Gasu_34620 [Galdieria sulphuraria]GJD12727.1 hypothetical protein Gasu2_68010 [Galdieria sulphuraria]|eukprot:XP_005705589.1 hypothetical protein Gasu_34620 [Galdieria sulphuraria]
MIDRSLALIILLYACALESFLFFAVIAQTKSQEPEAHNGIARTFGFLFLVECICLLCWVVLAQLSIGHNVQFLDRVFIFFFVLGLIASCIGGGYIAVPEWRRRSLRHIIVLLCFLVTLIYWSLFSSSLGVELDIPFIDNSSSRGLMTALQGSLLALCLCCFIRIFRPLKGRNGALILFLGNMMTFMSILLFKVLHSECAGTEKLLENCPLPLRLDHNALLIFLLLCSNTLGAEGSLRLMAAGNGMEGYLEIPDGIA